MKHTNNKTKKPLRVLMDADGVFVDFVHGVLQETHRLTGQTVRSVDITKWDLFDQISEITGRTDLTKLLPERVKQEHFCLGLPALPGAEEALQRLLQLDRDGDIHLLIATAPWQTSRHWMHERSHWFKKRGLPLERVIHATIKHPIAADLFFDDKPDNVSAWQNHNPYGFGYLWDSHHNQEEEKLSRCVGWDDFFLTIQRHLLRP